MSPSGPSSTPRARDQATSELEGLRVETQEQIAQLRADAAVELEEYRLTWQSEMAQLEEDTSRQLASFPGRNSRKMWA